MADALLRRIQRGWAGDK